MVRSCFSHGGESISVQGFGGNARSMECAWKDEAEMGVWEQNGFYSDLLGVWNAFERFRALFITVVKVLVLGPRI